MSRKYKRGPQIHGVRHLECKRLRGDMDSWQPLCHFSQQECIRTIRHTPESGD